MTIPVHVLGFSGSLRKNSYNKALLQAATELLPEGMTLETFELSSFPLFNQDFESQPPEVVIRFKSRIIAADALLIATPEYNFSIPGVLKNAIDWASRPPKQQPFTGKPVAIIGASTSNFGTVRAQSHLRQVFQGVNAFVVNKPEVLISRAAEKFDNKGRLQDEIARGFLHDLLVALAEWTQRLRGS